MDDRAWDRMIGRGRERRDRRG